MNADTTELRAGTLLEAAPYLLDAAAAEAYGAAVHEPPRRRVKNIHSDDEAAKKAGYRAPIAAGEQTFALVMQLLVDRFGERVMRGGRVEIALLKPVFYGDTLHASAEVERNEGDRIELRLRVENQDREPVLSGIARVPVR